MLETIINYSGLAVRKCRENNLTLLIRVKHFKSILKDRACMHVYGMYSTDSQ